MRIRKRLIPVFFLLMLICMSAMPIQASAVKLNKKSANVYVGKTVQLKVTGAAKKTTVWSSSNTAVAKVTSGGKVTGLKKEMQ